MTRFMAGGHVLGETGAHFHSIEAHKIAKSMIIAKINEDSISEFMISKAI